MCAKSSDEKCGQLVLPGDRLGVIEEFIPDAGTYVRDGVIYSKVVGRTLMDRSTRRVSVYSLVTDTRVPRIGSTVLAQAGTVQNDNALMRIFKIGKTEVSGVYAGMLHVSDVHMRYVDSMFEVCKQGDIVRAKVVSDKNRVYHLSTKDKNLGVIYAFCSRCGFMLEQKHQDMECPRCKNIEQRKTAADYGQDMIE